MSPSTAALITERLITEPPVTKRLSAEPVREKAMPAAQMPTEGAIEGGHLRGDAHILEQAALGPPRSRRGSGARAAPVAVPAGWPSPAQDYYEGPIDLNEHLITDQASTFIVRVSGHSMEGAGISDGDELIVDRSLTAREGSVVVAVIDGELTIKRLQIHPTAVVLQAANPGYPDIRVPELSELSIWGVVTRCLHRL